MTVGGESVSTAWGAHRLTLGVPGEHVQIQFQRDQCVYSVQLMRGGKEYIALAECLSALERQVVRLKEEKQQDEMAAAQQFEMLRSLRNDSKEDVESVELQALSTTTSILQSRIGQVRKENEELQARRNELAGRNAELEKDNSQLRYVVLSSDVCRVAPTIFSIEICVRKADCRQQVWDVGFRHPYSASRFVRGQ